MGVIRKLRSRSSTASPDTKVDGNLCPRAAADINSWVLYEKSEGDLYCIGSIEQDKYITVPEPKLGLVLEIVALFDGTHSINCIQNYYKYECHQQVDVTHVYQLLSSANLIVEPKPTHVFQGEFKRFSFDVVDINTRQFFERLQPFAQRTFKPLVLITLVLAILGMASFRLEYFALSDLFTVNESYTLGYLALFLVGQLLTVVHEFSHAFTAAAYGVTARHFKVALYMGLLPTFYTEIAGMYTLKPQDRIKVWAAGCYSNMCMGSTIFLVYRMLSPHLSPVVGQIMLKAALGNLLAIIGNLSPLMPTDGYFIISTLLKQANIRTNAFQEFFNKIRGQESKLKGTLLAYFLATSLIILGVWIIQIRWIVGILYEVFQGSPNIQTLQSRLLLLIVGLFLIVQVALRFVTQTRKKKST